MTKMSYPLSCERRVRYEYERNHCRKFEECTLTAWLDARVCGKSATDKSAYCFKSGDRLRFVQGYYETLLWFVSNSGYAMVFDLVLIQ